MARRSDPLSPTGQKLSYSFRVVGGRPLGFRDAYHAMLRMPWWAALSWLLAIYLLLNLIFACIYLWVGGVGNARPGSFWDAYFFSVETMATIGYGAMYPAGFAANVVMVVESLIGLLSTALVTGLVFARFSRLRGRVVFSQKIAFSPMDGVPTLQIRVGNERTNRIFDATFSLLLTRTIRTEEGQSFYRTEDLKLVRERAHSLARSWTLLHKVGPDSPLFGQTPESLAQAEAEIIIALSGVDETSLQPIHARYQWEHPAIAWGTRLADVLSEEGDVVTLDLSHFHELTATAPSADFPYPRAAN